MYVLICMYVLKNLESIELTRDLIGFFSTTIVQADTAGVENILLLENSQCLDI